MNKRKKKYKNHQIKWCMMMIKLEVIIIKIKVKITLIIVILIDDFLNIKFWKDNNVDNEIKRYNNMDKNEVKMKMRI